MGSWGTWLVGAIVVLIIALAILKVFKDHKRGNGCGCGCDSCSACPGGIGGQAAKRPISPESDYKSS